MDAKSSAAVPLPSPAAAQRCAKGAGLDSGTAAAAQSAMPSIALPATASTADLLSTNAAAPAVPQLPSVSNLHQLDGRDLSGGGVDAVEGVFGDGRAPAVRRLVLRQPGCSASSTSPCSIKGSNPCTSSGESDANLTRPA